MSYRLGQNNSKMSIRISKSNLRKLDLNLKFLKIKFKSKKNRQRIKKMIFPKINKK